MHCSRREFLAVVAGTLPLPHVAGAVEGRRPKITALTTIYHKYSHSQHIVDRFLEGYGWEGRHHRPQMDVVSLYVEQVEGNDLSRERENRYPQLKIFPTIADALTLGGNKLAVDGVLLIAEHGNYPENEKGQKLYPRYESSKSIARAGSPRRCSMTSTCRGTGNGQRRWWTHRTKWALVSWLDRRCRSPVDCRRSICPGVLMSKKHLECGSGASLGKTST